MNLICAFDLAIGNKAWTVPIEVINIPTKENIQTFVKEVNELQNDNLIADCFMICDRNLKIVYQCGEITKEDLAEAFDVIHTSSFIISEVE